MKHFLLLTYFFPPRPGSGSVRPGGLAKYLPEFGWEPVVLTPRLPSGRRPARVVVETDFQDALQIWKSKFKLQPDRCLHEQLGLSVAAEPNSRRLHTALISSLKHLIGFPDPIRTWKPYALEAIARMNGGERLEAIVSTSPPHSCHMVAAEAKKRLGCPWIADFRDLWTQNVGRPNRIVPRFAEALVEKRTLAGADALVSVSENWAGRLRQRYADKLVEAIPNGFDPDDFPEPPPPLTKTFSITYAGILYGGKRDPSPLLEVLRELIEQGTIERKDLIVRFYGPIEPWLGVLAQRLGVADVVSLGGNVSRHEALEKVKESQLLLLLGWNNPAETGQHTGKLFEYLGARRPILAVGGSPGAMTQVLRETNAGIHPLSKDELRAFVVKSYREFKQSGGVAYHGKPEAIEKYSHREMARKFASLLNRVTSERPTLASLPLPGSEERMTEHAGTTPQ